MAGQPDGKIVVGGWATDRGGGVEFAPVRVSDTGSLDNSFGTGGLVMFAPLGGALANFRRRWASSALFAPSDARGLHALRCRAYSPGTGRR